MVKVMSSLVVMNSEFLFTLSVSKQGEGSKSARSGNRFTIIFTVCYSKPSKECADYNRKGKFWRFSVMPVGPVRIMMIENQGKKVGFESASGKSYSDSPTLTYSNSNDFSNIDILNDVNGVYKIFVTGVKDGSFSIIDEHMSVNSLPQSAEYDGTIK